MGAAQAIFWTAFLLDVKARRCAAPVPTHERNLVARLRDRVHVSELAWAEAVAAFPDRRLKGLAAKSLADLLAPDRTATFLVGLDRNAGYRAVDSRLRVAADKAVGRADEQCWHCQSDVPAGVVCDGCHRAWHFGCAMSSLRDTQMLHIVPSGAAFGRAEEIPLPRLPCGTACTWRQAPHSAAIA